MIVLIDNYDSFSYNLYQQVAAIDPDVRVVRNDAVSIADLRAMEPEAIVLSPGPGRPADAGICEAVVQELGGEVPILGVCLGHQAIVEALGGTVGYAKELMHGKASVVSVESDSAIFDGLPAKVTVGRYHSLSAEPGSLPESLRVVAIADDGEVMAVEHRSMPIYGLQFHPESILTPEGTTMMSNFLNKARAFNGQNGQR